MDSYRNPVPTFSVKSASAEDWTKWKRELELYFEAENITAIAKKKAKLLFYGGRELQDLFYSLPTPPELTAPENAYTQAIKLIEEHMGPAYNELYERHMTFVTSNEAGC
ncbi:hypothetical protein PGB90_009732 [Kerria lacca]